MIASPALQVHCGRITKQGNRPVRWAAIERGRASMFAVVQTCTSSGLRND